MPCGQKWGMWLWMPCALDSSSPVGVDSDYATNFKEAFQPGSCAPSHFVALFVLRKAEDSTGHVNQQLLRPQMTLVANA
eukprot:4197197-Pleurochrysis_carterae.AAC.2